MNNANMQGKTKDDALYMGEEHGKTKEEAQ